MQWSCDTINNPDLNMMQFGYYKTTYLATNFFPRPSLFTRYRQLVSGHQFREPKTYTASAS